MNSGSARFPLNSPPKTRLKEPQRTLMTTAFQSPDIGTSTANNKHLAERRERRNVTNEFASYFLVKKGDKKTRSESDVSRGVSCFGSFFLALFDTSFCRAKAN